MPRRLFPLEEMFQNNEPEPVDDSDEDDDVILNDYKVVRYRNNDVTISLNSLKNHPLVANMADILHALQLTTDDEWLQLIATVCRYVNLKHVKHTIINCFQRTPNFPITNMVPTKFTKGGTNS